MQKTKFIIVFNPYEKKAEVEVGTSLMDAAKSVGIRIESLCSGRTKCGKCKVKISQGVENLNAISEAEKKLINHELIAEGFRLACAAKIESSEEIFGSTQEGRHITVEIPPGSREEAHKILTEVTERSDALNSFISRYPVNVPKPTLEDPTPDFERLTGVLNREYGLINLEIDYDLLKELPNIVRGNEGNGTVTVWDNRHIISIEQDTDFKRSYGVAVDVGTTTVVGYLIDLSTGKLMTAEAILNEQMAYGDDIMTRMSHIMENPNGLNELNGLIIKGLNRIMVELCARTGVQLKDIFEATIVGNTVMHHMLLKLDPKFLALSPYAPVIRRSINLRASDLGLKINPRANVHVLPIIAGYVGADAVGTILSTDLYKNPELTLAYDIGTNGEVILGNKDRIEVCSCAAGPALEGACLKHGMRGETGAIESVYIDDSNLDVRYKTIDDAPPKGICGSGIIDAIAEMLKAGVIQKTGMINLDLKHPRIREVDTVPEFVIAWVDETEEKIGDIVITQKDISEVQLAKASFYSGASLLMKERGVRKEDISNIFLAGAFGNYIDKESARIIGLYPDLPLNKVKAVGNAAGAGAICALLSRDKRKDAQMIAESAHYIELTITPGFEEELMSAMYFPAPTMHTV